MKFCPFLALLVRVTGCLGGESWGRKTGVAKSQDFVVGQLEFWQNKSTYLVEEEHQISVRGEKILTLVVIRDVFRKKRDYVGIFPILGGGLTQSHLFMFVYQVFFCMPKSS